MDDGQMEPRVSLDSLDPAQEDPLYWRRFRAQLLRSAAPELRRRRARSEVTIPDLLLSWGRLLVPGTVLTAAAAALLLFMPAEEPESPPLDVEELLVWDAGDDADAVPYGLFADEEPDFEVFLVAVEGGY